MSETTVAATLSSKAQDHFRGLWATVFYTPQSPPKIVLVCSANSNEGASTVACGLALAGGGTSLAPQGDAAPAAPGRVALVEFNVRSPSISQKLGLPAGPGTSDILTGGAAIDDAVHRVGPGQLDVLTIGTQTGRLLEILRSDRVRQFIRDLRERYDQVILDVAPVNPFPDAQIMAAGVDGVLMVVHAQHTGRETLLEAKKRLVMGGARILGVVLNLRTYPIPRFVYKRV